MSLADELAVSLQLPVQLVLGLAHKATHSYKTYEIPKKSGGTRTIHHPSRELKALQRWMLRKVVWQWKVHDAAFAYKLGRNIYQHAQAHEKSRYLLRLDLSEFFPSIKFNDILAYLDQRPPGTEQWDGDDRVLFALVISRHGELTIGAPTSPSVSNALCWELDSQLARFAHEEGLIYTRYADDLFFSSQVPNKLGSVPSFVDGVLNELRCPSGLRRNIAKTRHSSKRGRRMVTGIVLSSDGHAVLGRARRREIRGLVHQFESLLPEGRERLKGLLAFARSIEPEFINSLVLKYGSTRIDSAL